MRVEQRRSSADRRGPVFARAACRLRRRRATLPKVAELNPFTEKAVPLPGKRIPVMQAQEKVTGELADASAPIVLPPPRANDSWAQPGGEANNAPGHLAFGGAAQRGLERRRRHRLEQASAASRRAPIVYDGRVYTLDADGNVSAFATSGGSAVWRVSLRAASARIRAAAGISLGGGSDGGGYGGGLAVDGGRLYAASGYGNVVALDPQTGKATLGEAARGAGALLADGGRRPRVRRHARWALLLSRRRRRRRAVVGARPAAAGEPRSTTPARPSTATSSSCLIRRATSSRSRSPTARRCGRRACRARARPRSSTSMSDAARPAIDGGTVFAIGHAGRMVATQAATRRAAVVAQRAGHAGAVGRRRQRVRRRHAGPADGHRAPRRQDRNGRRSCRAPAPGPARRWPAARCGSPRARATLVGVDAATGRVVGAEGARQRRLHRAGRGAGRMYVLTDNAKLIALN